MSNENSLGWSDRFALIDKYTPSDDQICTAFGVNSDELATARELRTAGTFSAVSTIDVDAFANIFGGTGVTTHTKPTTKSVSPTTATKRVKTPKKRGRQGTKIVEAFTAVPASPTSVEAFATDHNVSIAVLRQSRRFDKTGITGNIKVKKDKESGTLMIWRDAPSA